MNLLPYELEFHPFLDNWKLTKLDSTLLSFSPLPTAGGERLWTVADSESPSGASACSVIEGRRPGTGGSSSGGVTSDGPSTPATEGISTTVLASPATTPAGFTPIAQHLINPMERRDVADIREEAMSKQAEEAKSNENCPETNPEGIAVEERQQQQLQSKWWHKWRRMATRFLIGFLLSF